MIGIMARFPLDPLGGAGCGWARMKAGAAGTAAAHRPAARASNLRRSRVGLMEHASLRPWSAL